MDNSILLLFQLLFPICGLLIGFILVVALAVGFSSPAFPSEGFLLFDGEEFEVVIVKSAGVMVFDLLSVCQGNGSRFVTLISVVAAPVVLMFTILLFLGSCLFNSPHVFALIIDVRVPSDNILFDINHGLHAGVIWLVFHPCDDDWMDVVQVWVPDSLEQATDLHFFWGSFPTFSFHNGVCVIEQ